MLEAIKERGEIVTKIAYSDWKRVGDYSRLLTQHAIRMVQRNLTPGGDKNGADITMALDALEMAFTHDHINAFVIVGGDSDFISLVEKLKQYGRKVIVVGGRQFTSVTMQKNCHEFIAYENLVGSSGRPAERGGRPVAATSDISKALPIVKRALKVLSEREVTPQLGLLKSTLLQLDSTFSEREYGAGSFRDFMEKVAQTGAVALKHAGRSMLVESREERRDEVVEDVPVVAADRAPRRSRSAPCDGCEPDVAGRRGRGGDARLADDDAGRHPRRAAGDPRRADTAALADVRPAGQAVPAHEPSKASTSASTASRRSSICCALPARKACCGSSAIARARCECSRAPNLVAKAAAPRFEEPVDLDETIDVEVPQQAVVDAPEESIEPVDRTGRRCPADRRSRTRAG